MSANVGSDNIVTNGLVLYLDAANYKSYTSGSTIWRDLSASNATGSLINGPTLSSDGIASILFDGTNDNVQVENKVISSMGSNNPRTIQVWVKNEKVGTYNTLGVICGYGVDTSSNLFILSIASNDRVFIWGSANNYTSTHSVTLNQWTNLAVTFSGTAVRVYKNGIADAGGTLNSINTLTTSPYVVAQGPTYSPLSGKVALNLAYNRVLSAAEILQNYNATKGRFGL